MTTGVAQNAALGWQTRVDGEIAALAVRGGETTAIVVATEDGTCYWFDDTGAVTARTDSGVDMPTDLALHPSHQRIAISGTDGYATWEPASAPTHHDRGWSSAVAYSRRGDLAVAVGKHVIVHDDSQGTPFVSAPTASTVTGVDWMPHGNRVAASAYGGVYVYDGQQHEPVRTHPYAGSHLAVAVNPNGRWVCSGNQDASVHIWRTADNDELEMAGYATKVTRLAFDATGRWFANNGAPELTVWDFIGKGPRGRKPRMLSGHQRVRDFAWRPGASGVLASVGSEGTVRVWDLTGMAAGGTRKAHRILPFDDARAVRWLDRSHMVVARANGIVELVDRSSS